MLASLLETLDSTIVNVALPTIEGNIGASIDEGIWIVTGYIISNVVDDVKAALSGMLSPTLRERFLGNASIREVFNITRVGKVAGCMVTEGMVRRGAKVRLLRDNIVIYTGKVSSLRRFKDDVSEVKSGQECGITLENFADIKQADIIEAFVTERVATEVFA